MPLPPPTIPDTYTDAERALIAGYLLHHRAGTLQALSSCSSIPAEIDGGSMATCGRYYRDAEAYSRFLLYWIGYPVGKGRMYAPP